MYTPTAWVNGTAPAINAANLGKIEAGIAAAHQRGIPIVASSDAPANARAAAEFVCDGVADQVELNNAMNAATGQGSTGKVLAIGGRFICNAPVLMRTGVDLEACGWTTEFMADNITSNAGSGSQVALVKLFDINTHACRLSHVRLNGNYAAGGVGHVLCWEGATSGDSHSGYPATNPDPMCRIENVYVDGAANSTSRNGLDIRTDMRGTMITNCLVRNINGIGVYFNASPDSQINGVYVGGPVTGSGIANFVIAGASNRIVNSKSFFSDGWGLEVTGTRCTVAGFESQDDVNGVRLAQRRTTCAAINIDTWQSTALSIESNQIQVTSFMAYNRGAGSRYPGGSGIGLNLTAGATDCTIFGSVDPSLVTTPIQGAPGARTFMRVSNGSSIVSAG